jgi:hypothetical protein
MTERVPRPAVESSVPEGSALIAVVFALVVLETAVAGALFVCSIEAATTRAFTRRAQATLAAESAVAAALAGWDADAIAALALGDTLGTGPLVLPAGSASGRIERLAGDAYLVTGRTRLTGPAGDDVAGAAALVGWHPPAAFADDAGAAIVAGGTVDVRSAGTVDGRGSGAGCSPADTLPAATFPAAAAIVAPAGTPPSQAAGAAVLGSPAIASLPIATAAFDRLGPYPTATLAGAAERLESGTVALGPVAGPDGCDDSAPGNWGAPPGSTHPCAGFVPLIHAPGDLSILGGTGFGLLLVDGDLLLEAGSTFHGIAVVRGRATVRGELHGLLRTAGGADIDGAVLRDACSIWTALTRVRPLSRPSRPPRWRVPWF